MVAFALATEPLPPGSPKWVRHVWYPVGPLMPVLPPDDVVGGVDVAVAVEIARRPVDAATTEITPVV